MRSNLCAVTGRVRIPLLTGKALAKVEYRSRFNTRGLRLGLHQALVLKRDLYPHLREVK